MNMQVSRRWLVSIGATLAMLIVLWTISTVMAQATGLAGGAQQPAIAARPAAMVNSRISYQGVLKESGAPVTGTRDMTFNLYTNSSCSGAATQSISKPGVSVSNGLFSTELDVTPSNFNGQGLWLAVVVGGTSIGCTEILPAPYALSLRPNAQIQGEPSAWEGGIVKVTMDGAYPLGKAVWGNAATGSGIRGDSTGGWGVYGYTEDGYAVRGYDAGSSTARGYGGYFSSDNGVGVYGYSGATSYYTNMYAPGVYGKSANGVGVYGVGSGSNWPSYGGYFQGRTGIGVRSTGTSTQDGYAGSFVSENYRGIYALSQTGWYDAYFVGIGGIYSAGGVFSVSPAQTIVLNGGDEPLESGDIVAIAGIAGSPVGGQPMLAVRKADASNSAAIIGVAVQAMRVEAKEVEKGIKVLDVQPVEGQVPRGGYLAIVTSGLAPAVKVDRLSGGLGVGDWLSMSATSGTARKANTEQGSNIAMLGKVAGPVDAKTGTVPVFVILR